MSPDQIFLSWVVVIGALIWYANQKKLSFPRQPQRPEHPAAGKRPGYVMTQKDREEWLRQIRIYEEDMRRYEENVQRWQERWHKK